MLLKQIYGAPALQITLNKHVQMYIINVKKRVDQGDNMIWMCLRVLWKGLCISIDEIYLNHIRFPDNIVLISSNILISNKLISKPVGLHMVSLAAQYF